MAEKTATGRKRTSLELPLEWLEQIDSLRREWGLRNRGAVLERLLGHVLGADAEDAAEALPTTLEEPAAVQEIEPAYDDQLALVLVGRGDLDLVESDFPVGPERPLPSPVPRSSGGIDLPGFVQRRSHEIKHSLRPREPQVVNPTAPLPGVAPELIQLALDSARQHWIDLYGQPPNATVLEFAMIWLARDIWPQSDLSEGELFTWSAALRGMQQIVPQWPDTPPTFERVMVTAGMLEDPFSAATLAVRLPTLIRRFVHRFRQRRRGTSFQTLEHTMTLQGAMRLLQLPTDPGRRLTLREIRDAYKEMALQHHPDSGGSVEAMRRINEAYQLLKELYRAQPSYDTISLS